MHTLCFAKQKGKETELQKRKKKKQQPSKSSLKPCLFFCMLIY